MSTRIEIDPITRLEGHGKIEIFLDDAGEVDRAYLSLPELRGFEIFSHHKPAELMPQITSRICGVCPLAHHMAATRALDALYQIKPPPAAEKLREMVYNMFMFEDHTLHFYILGGPDFIVGPTAPKAERNVFGVLGKVGAETVKQVIAIRKEVRELINFITGKVIHPVWGLPGGVVKGLKKEDVQRFREAADKAVEFGRFTLQAFKDIVLANSDYVDLITSDMYTHKTYYMSLVDENNKVNFYQGKVRVVDPEGNEFLKFNASDYQEHLAEHIEPWTYIKFLYLKKVGWKGFVDGKDSGVYGVAPLARMNASTGFTTPEAQAAREEYFETLGGSPVHFTLATHWARVIEILYAAEKFREIAYDESILDTPVRNRPVEIPHEGVGVVEAPRGTLFHHYKTDKNGLITEANLLVATQNNAARVAMSIEKAAKGLIHGGKADDGILNMVEMAFRAYDPCHACGTHSLPGRIPLALRFRDLKGEVLNEIRNF